MNDILMYCPIYIYKESSGNIEMNSKVVWLVDEEFYIGKKKEKEKKIFSWSQIFRDPFGGSKDLIQSPPLYPLYSITKSYTLSLSLSLCLSISFI
jgi:hypothetical protein